MTARDEAIEAAARTMAAQNMAGGASPWDAKDDEPGFAHTYGWASPSEFRRGHREMAAEVLAASVPVLLNDLADRIEAETAQWKHTVSEDCWYTCPAATEGRDGGECCNDAMGTECDCGRDSRAKRVTSLVRAAAEGWGA